MRSATVGIQASWVGGGLLCAALVLLALAVPVFRRYDAYPAGGQFTRSGG